MNFFFRLHSSVVVAVLVAATVILSSSLSNSYVVVSALATPPPPAASSSNRRNLLEQLVQTSVGLAVGTAGAVVAWSPSAAVASSSGDEEEEENNINNDFIAKLKAQSDAKRDLYRQQAQSSDKLSSRQFASQYQRPTYLAVRRVGGYGPVEMILETDVQTMINKGLVEKKWDG